MQPRLVEGSWRVWRNPGRAGLQEPGEEYDSLGPLPLIPRRLGPARSLELVVPSAVEQRTPATRNR